MGRSSGRPRGAPPPRAARRHDPTESAAACARRFLAACGTTRSWGGFASRLDRLARRLHRTTRTATSSSPPETGRAPAPKSRAAASAARRRPSGVKVSRQHWSPGGPTPLRARADHELRGGGALGAGGVRFQPHGRRRRVTALAYVREAVGAAHRSRRPSSNGTSSSPGVRHRNLLADTRPYTGGTEHLCAYGPEPVEAPRGPRALNATVQSAAAGDPFGTAVTVEALPHTAAINLRDGRGSRWSPRRCGRTSALAPVAVGHRLAGMVDASHGVALPQRPGGLPPLLAEHDRSGRTSRASPIVGRVPQRCRAPVRAAPGGHDDSPPPGGSSAPASWTLSRRRPRWTRRTRAPHLSTPSARPSPLDLPAEHLLRMVRGLLDTRARVTSPCPPHLRRLGFPFTVHASTAIDLQDGHRARHRENGSSKSS